MDFAYSTLILTKEEVSFLAGAMGIDKLYGNFDSGEELTEKGLYNILKSLIAKEFVICEEDAYVIDKQVRHMIEFMRDSLYQKVYGGNDNTLPVKCIYFSEDRALVCEQGYVSENELHLFELSVDELWELLEEEGYSKEDFTENDTN